MKLSQLLTKLQNKQLIKEFEGIKVKDSALNNYKNHVKGNNLEDEVLLSNKLKRNFMCGRVFRNNGKVEKRLYGNLVISMDLESKEIYYIYNHKTKEEDANEFRINQGVKDVLDIYIGVK